MSEWTVQRIALVAAMSAIAVSAAMAVDQSENAASVAAVTVPAARVSTSTTTALFASPTVHATFNGRCEPSSPNC